MSWVLCQEESRRSKHNMQHSCHGCHCSCLLIPQVNQATSSSLISMSMEHVAYPWALKLLDMAHLPAKRSTFLYLRGGGGKASDHQSWGNIYVSCVSIIYSLCIYVSMQNDRIEAGDFHDDLHQAPQSHRHVAWPRWPIAQVTRYPQRNLSLVNLIMFPAEGLHTVPTCMSSWALFVHNACKHIKHIAHNLSTIPPGPAYSALSIPARKQKQSQASPSEQKEMLPSVQHNETTCCPKWNNAQCICNDVYRTTNIDAIQRT